jgi:hypothetical protein
VRKVKDGFHTPTVKLAEEPSKKRNKIGAVLIDDETGKEALSQSKSYKTGASNAA